MLNDKVLILFGAPGSGKSESCNLLNKITNNKLKVLQKETTRPARTTDSSEILSVEKISKDCDIRYNQYGYEYGFSSKLIWKHLAKGNSVIVIVNDIRTIKILNKKFGSLTQNIYIHSNIDREKITKIAIERYKDKPSDFLNKDIDRRIEKIKTIHRKYIENTYLFHTSIINLYEEIDYNKSILELETQLKQAYLKNISCTHFSGSTSRIIIVAGGSFSGKDDLVNAMVQIEPEKTLLYQKGTTRPKKEDDKNELIHSPPKLAKKYNIQYEKNGYRYGLSTKEIWNKLAKQKIVLIVLSDLESILELKKDFNNICTVIYLHANIDKEEMTIAKQNMDKSEFEKRERSIKELHTTYTHNMDIFNHVLLNTSESEDLYDQAFNILDFYLGAR